MKIFHRSHPAMLSAACVVLILARFSCGATLPASIEPADLRCEYLANPVSLEVPQPRLSWKLLPTDPHARGQMQWSYQILVASSEALLAQDKPDLWDSGHVYAGDSVNLVYNGKPLVPREECFWKVRVTDEHGVWSSWSQPARWSMGLSSADWKASWIGSSEAAGKRLEKAPDGKNPANNTMADPWFRKSFTLPAAPARALIYVASVGYHEVYVNGRRVGDYVLAPSATDFKKRARYVTYDITKYLRAGPNAIGLWLGTSWAIFGPYQTDDKPAAPIVLAQAEIQLPGGGKMQIVTDSSWKTHASPNTLLGFWDAGGFGGESYDARLEIANWADSSLNDAGWKPVTVFHPKLTVSSEVAEPNRLVQEIKPVAVEEASPGVWRIDMGINYAGWFELQLSGAPGTKVEFEFSEQQEHAMTFGLHSDYIIGPSGTGTFRNRFNYMSGRWVQVTGLSSRPSLAQIRGWLIRTDYQRAGGFSCDQPLLNKVYDTTMWTFENLSLGNYVVDCPQRERRGYGGDAHATTRTALDNFQLAAFYTKWMQDWRDVQEPNGDVAHTAPTYAGGGGPIWSGFCVTLPWEMYRQYGDTRALRENFPTM